MLPSAALALTLALAAAQPAQQDKLEFANIRGTHGMLGPTRKDFTVLPGEALFVSFDITGLKADEIGRTRFTSKLEVKDAAAKSIFKKNLGEVRFVNVLASKRVQHSFVVPTGLDAPPGKYSIRVDVEDQTGKATGSFTQPFEVAKLEFGIVQLQFSYDEVGTLPAPSVAVVGQVLYVNVAVIGFKRNDKNENRGEVTVEMNILDAADRPVPAKPLSITLKDIPADTQAVPVGFNLPVTSAGQYKIVVKATDEVAKKPAPLLTVPFTAVDAK